MDACGSNKPAQKRAAGSGGTGWLRSPQGFRVVRITSLPPTAHAQWCEVITADMDGDRIQSLHNRRMLRFNAEQLWKNLLRQGWQRVPPQW
jgi:hypothetical protein